MSLQNRGIDKVERGSGVPMGQAKKGVGFPGSGSLTPNVKARTNAVLPQGMDSGMVIDESTGGNPISLREFGGV